MAPKGSPTPKGKPGPPKKEATSKNVAEEAAGGGDDAPAAVSNAAAPTNRDEVLAQVNLDGLPHCPTEQIIDSLK